jgi:hypothetical protein
MENNVLTSLLLISGLGHIVLSVASLSIPKVLKWRQHLHNLEPLLRQMFWTYAAYILVINFSFGIISLIATDELLNGSMLAKSITFFISVYWLARIGIQFFYFDRSQAPKGFIYSIGEVGLILLFGLFTVVYFLAFLHNNSWI